MKEWVLLYFVVPRPLGLATVSIPPPRLLSLPLQTCVQWALTALSLVRVPEDPISPGISFYCFLNFLQFWLAYT